MLKAISILSTVALFISIITVPVQVSAASAQTKAAKTATDKRLAAQLLALWRAKKIGIANYSENKASDTRDRSLASVQLLDISKKGYAQLSRRCTNMGGRTTVVPDTRVLQFLVAQAKSDKYTITVLFGQCHKTGSAHYVGKGVDFACTVNYKRVDTVAKRYGLKRNHETCARHYHWHYSVGGV